MGSREKSSRDADLFQLQYYMKTNYDMERWTRRKKILIKALTKPGSFIDAYALTCDFFKCNYGF